MGPEDGVELSKEIIEAAKNSSDAESLEIGLWSVINDYSERFPEIGRASALHEAVSFMFNNNARHFTFFPELALMAYEAQVAISKWHDASTLAEHMTGYQIELLMNRQGDEENLRIWFTNWTNTVREWASTDVNEQTWQDWGTGILIRCEQLAIVIALQQDVYTFWDSMIDTYGSFAPTEETIQRHETELLQISHIVLRESDLSRDMRKDFTSRVRLLHRLETGDLVDRMNRLIELAPKPVEDEEIEVEMNLIGSAKDIREACQLTNDLATRLRLQGDIEKGIEILSSVLETENEPAEIEELATSALKLAIYLDETGRQEDAEPWFKKIADAEHGSDSVSITTVHQACERYSSFLVEAGKLAESKEYGIRGNALAEVMGDPLLFVRSCFNIVADCHELGQGEEAEEWFVLGMANLRDGLGDGPLGQIPPKHQQALLEQSSNISGLIGQEQAWTLMMQHIFRDGD